MDSDKIWTACKDDVGRDAIRLEVESTLLNGRVPAMLADHISVSTSQWSEERAMVIHLILTTLAGEEAQLAIEIQEHDRFQEFENAVIEQLPMIGESTTFGCELKFVCRNSQQTLVDPIWQTLRDCNCFTVVVSPCIEVAERKGQMQGEAKALRTPFKEHDKIFPQAFEYVTKVRHLQVDAGYRIIGEGAWRNCQHLQIVHLASTVTCLQAQVFRRCYALRQILAPGCKQFGTQVFEECCSLLQIGIANDTINQLAPQAELMPRAFRKCTALRQINLELTEYSPQGLTRCLPECCFLEAGLTSLTLPPDFTWIGPAACERCMQLQLVDLSRTKITEIMSCAFAHCKHLRNLKLPGLLRMIRQEAFLHCTSLTEIYAPPTLLYIARRAFGGCAQLYRFQRYGKSVTWRGTYARENAFLRCDNLDTPNWIRWLPRTQEDEDQWADDSLATL